MQKAASLLTYLSSALTGRMSDADLLLNVQIKDRLASAGIDVYLPQESSKPGQKDHADGLTAAQVYMLDRWRVAESDFLLVRCDALSFGVGQEVEIASALGMPIILFAEHGRQVSRMLAGNPSNYTLQGMTETVMRYWGIDDLETALLSRIRSLGHLIHHDQVCDDHAEWLIQQIREASTEQGVAPSALAARACLPLGVVELVLQGRALVEEVFRIGRARGNSRFVMRRPNMSEARFLNISTTVLQQLAGALELSTMGVARITSADEPIIDAKWLEANVLWAYTRGMSRTEWAELSPFLTAYSNRANELTPAARGSLREMLVAHVPPEPLLHMRQPVSKVKEKLEEMLEAAIHLHTTGL